MPTKGTVHTSRTLMWKELAAIMGYAHGSQAYLAALDQNLADKATLRNQKKTNNFLKRLYGFDTRQPGFQAFQYFWGLANAQEQLHLTLLYALHRDFLLAESVELIRHIPIGHRLTVDSIAAYLAKLHPERYSQGTLTSAAQNIASSWKQAGWLKGKYKNERQRTESTWLTTCFALLMGFLEGKRGAESFDTLYLQVFDQPVSELHTLAFEAARRDFIDYRQGGSVTILRFDPLLEKLALHDLKD